MRKRNKIPTLFEDKGNWYFFSYDESGKRRKISCCTKSRKDAEAVLKEFIRVPVVQIEKRKTLKSCIKEFANVDTNPRLKESEITGRLYSHLHAVNMQSKAKRLLETIPSKCLLKPVKDLSRIECIEIRKQIWLKYGPTSVSYNIWKAFKSILSYCSQAGYIIQSPASGLANISYEKQQRVAIPAKDIKTIWKSNLFLFDEYRAFFGVLATTGMRRGEAAALCTAQLNERNGIKQILINRARKDEDWKTIGLPKMNIIRTIPIANVTYEILKPYLKPDAPSDLIFPNITRQGIKICFDRIRCLTDFKMDFIAPERIQKISPHVLRHSLNTELVLSKLNNILVQEYLSWHHQDLGTQEGYTHIYAENLLPVAEQIDRIFG